MTTAITQGTARILPLRLIAVISKIRLLFIVLLALVGWQTGRASELPNLGNPNAVQLSPAKEAKLGHELMTQLAAAGLILDDPIATDYIKSIGNRLVSHLPPANKKRFHFFIVTGHNVNAFAGPMGNIGINTGLIEATRTESELAAVMVHEMAHVTQGHLAEKLTQNSNLRYSTWAALLIAVALGTQSPQAASGAVAATLAGAEQSVLNFSRIQEKEADRLGMETLSQAGFDPHSMPDFFSHLQQEERYSEQLPELLSSHPLTEDRIADTQNRAAKYPRHTAIESSLTYYLVKNRIRLETTQDPQAALHYFEAQIKTPSSNPLKYQATQYGYGLALIHAGKPQAAYPLLENLAVQFPDNLLYQLAYANAALNIQQPEKALQLIAKLYDLHPDSYPITLTYAKALIQFNQPQKAAALLQKYLLLYPNGPKPYDTLARAQAKAGHRAESYQTRANYFLNQQQPQKALDQLKMALALPDNNSAMKDRLKAKITAIKSMMRRHKNAS